MTRQDAPWCVLGVPAEVVAMTSTETPVEETRSVLVTGSTSGIGAATARALALQGWRVVVTGRDQARGSAVVDDVQSAGGAAVFVPSDLTCPPDALRTFARTVTEAVGGRLDAVVHNAALCPAVDTVSLTDADLEATLAVNVRAPHVLTAALAPAMGSGATVRSSSSVPGWPTSGTPSSGSTR